MFYQGIILDLDNTLYDYPKIHNLSLSQVILKLLDIIRVNYLENTKLLSENEESLFKKLFKITRDTKNELINCAASHHRMIYFKKLLEQLNISLLYLEDLNTTYWNFFLDNIKLFDGVKEFIKWHKQKGIKIAILTDFLLEYQIKKLNKLQLLDTVDIILTSEETNQEKPSSINFLKILSMMQLSANQVIMIGDEITKDIQGAQYVNIKTFHYDPSAIINSIDISSNNTFFNNWNNLLLTLSEIYNDLQKFTRITNYISNRYDLAQAGGGNISFKNNNLLFIKSSGIHLNQITLSSGYCILNNELLKSNIMQNYLSYISDFTEQKLDIDNYKINILNDNKPSIETSMHCILNKFTAHFHSIFWNQFLTLEKDKASLVIKEIFQKFNINITYQIVNYTKPGLDLTLEIMRNIYHSENANYLDHTKIYFLLNHGIIITSHNEIELLELCDILHHPNIITKYSNHYLSSYLITSKIQTILNLSSNHYIEKCDDKVILDNFDLYLKNKDKILFPDEVVYCNPKYIYYGVNTNQLSDATLEFVPWLIYLETEGIYLISKSRNKIKDLVEILKSKILLLLGIDNSENINVLSKTEVDQLINWDAEIYRKQLNN